MQKLGALLDRYPRWLALAAGGVSATGFAPLGLWPLTLLCLALLMHMVATAATGKRALLLGWLFGIGHFSVGNNWIATAFTFQDAMPAWLGWIAVVLLALYLAVYLAMATWGAWWISKYVCTATTRHPVVDTGSRFFRGLAPIATKSGTPHQVRSDGNSRFSSGTQPTVSFIVAFAGCWIITEWLRAWVFTGYSWNPLAAIVVDAAWLVVPVKYLGTYGLSGLILLAVGLTILFAKHLIHELKSKPLPPARIAFVIAFFILPEAIILAVLPYFLQPAKAEPGRFSITIVQPNISQTVKHVEGYEAVNFSRLARHSRPLDDKPRLLLWPEAAIPWWLEDGYPRHVYLDQPGSSAAGTRALLARLLGPDDILLTGNDRLEFGREGKLEGARNAVLAIEAEGDILASYDKAHLVPFGEYLALRWLLEPLGATRLVPGAIDFLAGPGPRTLNLGAGKPKVGMQICYEIIFSGQVVDRANRPDFIFNPSNDAWFGGWGSPQFLAQTRLRAIEEGLPVIRSTPTGISAVIDADGRVIKSLALGKAGRIDATLPVAKAATLFARFGNILPLGFAALLIALAFMPLARARASR